ncbi:MAG: hypothetical protein NT004_15130 [Bacteroidetes bacterium]|nr:hypothetical protein [Bacteroidota bacterium]
MKKQLLLIVLLAFFAGITNVNAQCASDGFHPSAGQPYNYVVQIDPAGGYLGSGVYDWYVTQDPNLLNAAAIILATNTFFTVNPSFSTYHSTTGTTNTLGLAWTSAAVSSVNPFYLVLKYRESNPNATEPGGCSAENIRVWQINPINTFLLAVTGAYETGNPFASATQCASALSGATVNPGATPTVTYLYGVNTLYYTITASGYTGNWIPQVQLPALNGLGQNYAAVEWTSDLIGGTGYVAFTGAAGNSAGGAFTSPSPATITNPTTGTPILIRVQVANVSYETLANQAITLGADGTTSAGSPDIIGGTGTNACDPENIFGKTAIYTILARPTVNPGATMPTFIPKNP